MTRRSTESVRRGFRKRILIGGLLTVVALGMGRASVGGEPAATDAAFAPGEILDKSNWEKATGLLPPELLQHYRDGDYANPVEPWDEPLQWDAEWQEAVRSNRERLTVNEQGSIIDKTSGTQPPYVYGYPFPDIEPSDPNAGVKILWNYFYEYYHNGNRRNTIELTWLSTKSVVRQAGQDVYFLYYDGQPPARAPQENPDNLLFQFVATTLDPADLQGTTAVSWRYRDADKRDAVWSYVPALRRVRPVSPTNRSDGFLGSDLSQDDGAFFDGKPEDFVWKLVAQKEQLVLADPARQRNECVSTPLPEGGWQTDFKDVPMVGFQDPDWEGLAWAPVSQVLLRRPVWVIEGEPRDRYYFYGKVQLYIDRQTYQGSWNRKFSWKGELLNTFQAVATGQNRSPDNGKSYFSSGVGGCIFVRIAENRKLHRATAAAVDPKTNPISWTAVPLQPSFFDHATLARFGK